MFGLKIEIKEDTLIMKWRFTKIEIPLSEIVEVTEDDTYGGGQEKNAIRLGFPSATTDRIVIKTTTETYLLYTSAKKKLLALV
ncbi:PH domain-containing protein [Mesobacillus maritimus]|uniref:SunI/YnzG family protein n=1 Tax=Mesobacillus maritimus TaxID=1643336 RepID=UPI0020402D42|nr:PH domain-containing protein [Mesobacillus maritimus]MCM3584707.1 PH domain-containing protein [Mesobacillus maritimus]MCM3671307.1 PH domain-containing protein [Mesobacillus maritimus]